MDIGGYVVLFVGAPVIGLIAEYARRQELAYEWLFTAIGAGIGGFVASEALGTWSAWGPEWGGLRLFPALIGAVVVGAVVAGIFHYLTTLSTSGNGTSRPQQAG